MAILASPNAQARWARRPESGANGQHCKYHARRRDWEARRRFRPIRFVPPTQRPVWRAGSCRGWGPVSVPDGMGFDAYTEASADEDRWVGSTDERSQQVLLSVRIVRGRPPRPVAL